MHVQLYNNHVSNKKMGSVSSKLVKFTEQIFNQNWPRSDLNKTKNLKLNLIYANWVEIIKNYDN